MKDQNGSKALSAMQLSAQDVLSGKTKGIKRLLPS